MLTEQTISMSGVRNQVSRYRVFVEAGLDEEAEKFYGKKKQTPIIGGESFVQRLKNGIR
jgi:hypothetical protein